MLEEQPLDLSVRDYPESKDGEDAEQEMARKEASGEASGYESSRLAASEYGNEREDRTCSEDSDDSCSDQKDAGLRIRGRAPGTKPYKKNLMRRYRKSLFPEKRVLEGLFGIQH